MSLLLKWTWEIEFLGHGLCARKFLVDSVRFLSKGAHYFTFPQDEGIAACENSHFSIPLPTRDTVKSFI